MQQFEDTHHYPETPVEKLFALFSRPEFWQQKYAAMGHLETEIRQCEQGPDGILRIETRRLVPLKVPRVARKIISPFNEVLQHDRWLPSEAGERAGTWQVEVVGRPVEVSGTSRLVPDGQGGCRNHVSGQLTISVPVVGGVAARLLVGDARRALAEDYRFNTEYLKRLRAR